MSKREKRRKRILETPTRSDIRFDEMEAFLSDEGFIKKKSNGSGSHRLYFHPTFDIPVNIQSQDGLIKKYQIIQIQKIIKQIENGEKK